MFFQKQLAYPEALPKLPEPIVRFSSFLESELSYLDWNFRKAGSVDLGGIWRNPTYFLSNLGRCVYDPLLNEVERKRQERPFSSPHPRCDPRVKRIEEDPMTAGSLYVGRRDHDFAAYTSSLL